MSPVNIIQPFGANPGYYARFIDSHGVPEKGHMGIDFTAEHGHPIYASHDGQAVAIKDSHGGEGVWIYARGYATINWHLIGDTDLKYPPVIPFDNKYHTVKTGDLIGYADNTGAPFESSGDHFHFGLVFIDSVNNVLNSNNGYGGCVDPLPYLNTQPQAPFIFTTPFGYKTTSNDVMMLQKRLGVIQTGYYGVLTMAAVVKYQIAHLIPPTGYCGVLTIASLNSGSKLS